MGRIIKAKYRVELMENIAPGKWQLAVWRDNLSPNHLESYVEEMNKSFEHGGVNYHVSRGHKVIVYIYSARLVEQETNNVVAEWKAPMFQVR